MTKRDTLFFVLIVLFVVTIVITLLGVTKVIEIDDFYLKGLFGAFIIELGAAVFGIVNKGNLLGGEQESTDISSPNSNSIKSSGFHATSISTTGIRPRDYLRIIEESDHVRKTGYGYLESITIKDSENHAE